jgi:hypothetical protein
MKRAREKHAATARSLVIIDDEKTYVGSTVKLIARA